MSTSEEHQYRVRTATGWSLAIATICVILRFLARRLKKQPIFWDDLLILVALVFEWGIGIAGLILLENGLGLHIDKVKPSNLVVYLKVLYTGAPLYALTIVFTKLSLLVLYHRVFPIKYITYTCLVVGTTVVAWGLTTMFIGLFLCDPVQKVWYPWTPGHCFDLGRFYYGLQVPNIITDVIILGLPIRPILTLPISRSQRILLSIIFGFGFLAIVFDVVRLVVMIELSQGGPDITWNQVATSIWTCVEPAVAISTACLSHLRPVCRYFRDYWKLERYPKSPNTLKEKDRSPFAISQTSTIDGSRSKNRDAKGLHHESIDFGAHITFNDISAMETGAQDNAGDNFSRSSISSDRTESTLTDLDSEAPSFPAIADLLETNPITRTASMNLDTIGDSSTASGYGTARRSAPPFTYLKPLPSLP